MVTEIQPYIGPRPYERDDQDQFFGRDHEAYEFISLIISSREVLFYAQSGTGKTSLLNAKVIPVLIEEEGFEVFPLARVQGIIPREIQPEEIQNIFVFNTLVSWAKDEANPVRLAHMTISEFLNERKRSTDNEGQPVPRALIFDQFEEIFTLYQDRWNDRDEFFKQVRDALKDDNRLLRVIFAIREDYIAQLDPYAPVLPEKLRTRFRMERLRQDAALEAIEKPIRSTKCSFAPGVAEKLVEDLQKTKVETMTGETIEIIGEFVEPVQLQVVCQNLWNELPPDATEITEKHLLAFGGVDRPLSRFYEVAVKAAATKAGIVEEELRDWCEKWLITSTGTRGIVHRGPQLTEGIHNTALDILEARHLINSEWRAGARWYELTHDRLIDPIRASNESWKKQKEEKVNQASLLIRQAEQSITLQKYDRALDTSMNAYTLSEEIGDLQGEALAFFNIGKAYEGKKQYDKALTTYAKALELVKQTDARDIEANLLETQGILFAQMKEDKQSEETLTGDIALLPNDPVDYNNRGLAYYNLKQYELAIEDYTRALELDPTYVHACNNRGLAYYALKQYERAIKDYNRVFELDATYVKAYYNRGLVYYILKQYDLAIEDYTRALELDPAYIMVYYNRGLAYKNLKQNERAIEDYDRALELDPTYVNAYNGRGSVYYALKEYERASEDYTRALELDPKYFYAYYNRGLVYYALKEYERAIEDYNRALELDPTYVNAYNGRGSVYSDLKQNERAIDDYNHALELDPTYVDADYNRGSVYSDLKQNERAIEDYDRALELDPTYVNAYYNRGNAYYDLKQNERAIEDYDRALGLDPTYINAYYNRGLVYYALKQNERAIEDYNRALELDPTYVNAYYNRGLVYYALKEYERASEDYTRALELDPTYVNAYNGRGLVYYALKEYERASEDYTRALELDPTYVNAYNGRGNAYYDLKQYERAIEDYTRALGLDPNYVDADYNRGSVYYDLKQNERAIEDYDRALELDPTYVDAYKGRGNAYSDLKEYERAIEDYDRALGLDPEFSAAYLLRGYLYLWLRDTKQAQKDFMRSWQLDSTNVNYGWMTEWSTMCQEKPDQETAKRLEKIAANDPNDIEAYICRGVALWIHASFEEAAAELNGTIPLNPELEDIFFWKGVVLAYLGQDHDAIAAIEKSLELDLPPLLLSPLRWTEQDRPDFYRKYAAPLLARFDM